MRSFISSILLLAVFSSEICKAQLTQEFSLPLKAEMMAVDALGQLYLINENHLIKYNESFEQTYTFSIKTKGRISTVDPSDPFKVMVYFADFTFLAWLDNTLSISAPPASLDMLDYPLVSAVSWSSDNHFWLYDQSSLSLVRLDSKFQPAAHSAPLSSITTDQLEVLRIKETANYLFVNNHNQQLLIFDRFGTFYKSISCQNIKDFHYEAPLLYIFSSSTMRVFNMKTLEEKSYSLPVTNLISAGLHRDRIFLLGPEGISVCRFKL
jgi:hypothetical protein